MAAYTARKALSPAATAASQASNGIEGNKQRLNATLNSASVASKDGAKRKTSPDRAAFSTAEKRAMYRMSGTGASISGKVWINLPV